MVPYFLLQNCKILSNRIDTAIKTSILALLQSEWGNNPKTTPLQSGLEPGFGVAACSSIVEECPRGGHVWNCILFSLGYIGDC